MNLHQEVVRQPTSDAILDLRFMVSQGFAVAVESDFNTKIRRNLNSLIHDHHPH